MCFLSFFMWRVSLPAVYLWEHLYGGMSSPLLQLGWQQQHIPPAPLPAMPLDMWELQWPRGDPLSGLLPSLHLQHWKGHVQRSQLLLGCAPKGEAKYGPHSSSTGHHNWVAHIGSVHDDCGGVAGEQNVCATSQPSDYSSTAAGKPHQQCQTR